MRISERADLLMGTVISQKVWGNRGDEAMAAVHAQMIKIDQLMSSYKPDSEVAKINAMAGVGRVTVDRDTLNVVALGLKYGLMTNGAFDITIAPLVKAWGIMTDEEKRPSDQELTTLKALVSYKQVSLDEVASAVGLAHQGQMIDLGGIAKGWACDKALEIYKAFGLDSAMINMGGNVAFWGGKPDHTPWRVGVQDPCSSSGEFLGVLSLFKGSVVTSGAYQRYFEHDGTTYHHILDPRTGMPAQTDLLSATLVAPLSSDAEGLSTPVFMAGLSGCQKLLNQVPGAEAVLVDKLGRVHVTQGLANAFTLTDGMDARYQLVQLPF